jgi:hypothetical protein
LSGREDRQLRRVQCTKRIVAGVELVHCISQIVAYVTILFNFSQYFNLFYLR